MSTPAPDADDLTRTPLGCATVALAVTIAGIATGVAWLYRAAHRLLWGWA